MLKVFRDNLKSFHWVLWIVIAVFVGLAFLPVGTFRPVAEGPNAPAAWAGDVSVSFQEYEREYRNQASRYRQMLGEGFTDEIAEGLRLRALDNALNQKLLLAEAQRLGLKVGDQELRKAIMEIGAFQNEDGKFVSLEEYRALLRRFGFGTIAEFEQTVRDGILTQKLQEALQRTVFVSDQDVEQSYRDRVEQAKVRYVMLPNQQFAAQAEVSEAELASYYQEHAEDYRLPEQRVVDYLLVELAPLRRTVTVDEQQVRAYYDQHPEEFSQAEEQLRARHILLRTDSRSVEEAEAILNQARQRITAGEDFAAVAREISEDPGSAERGGDLGFFGRGRMVPEFEQAAFGAQLNELVGPVKSPFGVHLLEVTERRPAGLRPFEEVSDGIQRKLAAEESQRQAEAQAGELLARLNRENARSEEQLKKIAEESENVTFMVTPPFDATTVVPGIGRSGPFTEAAFKLEKVGDLSAPVQLPRGWAVLSLKEKLEPRTPELAEVRGRVQQVVRQEKMQQLATERLQQAKQELASGRSLDEVAAELGVEAKSSDTLGRNGAIAELGPAGSQVARQAFELETGEIGGPLEYPLGAVLFQVTERTHWDPAQFEQEREQTRNTLALQQYQRLLDSLIKKRREDLNVQYAKQIVESTGLASKAS